MDVRRKVLRDTLEKLTIVRKELQARPPKVQAKPAKPKKKSPKLHSMYDNFVSVDPMEQTLLESAEERFLCRCCFKMFEFMEVQHLVDDNMTRMFQEVTDLVLIPCTRAPTVCGSCYGQMQRLVKFKELLILKQDQFELIMSCGGDLSELSGAKWKSENLNEDFLFEEETSEQDVQEVTLNQSVDGEDEEVDSFQQEISIDGDSDEGGDTSFVSNTSLASKNRTKGLSKIFVCDVCGEKPSTKRSLRRYQVKLYKESNMMDTNQYMYGLKKYSCEICDKSYPGAQKLNDHLLTHQGVRFPCYVPDCTVTKAYKMSMKKHLKTHDLTEEENEIYQQKLEDYYQEVVHFKNLRRNRLRKKIEIPSDEVN